MKEHLKRNSQIVKCHYCDFMNNDEAVFFRRIGDTHSPKFECGACGEEFTDTHKRVEHTMVAHAFNYSDQQRREDEH